MNFDIETSKLHTALTVVTPALNASADDVTSHYVFRPSKDGGLEVVTSSGRLFSSCPLETVGVELEEDGDNTFTLHSKRLDTWLSSITGEKVSFSFDGVEVTIASSEGAQTFMSLKPDSRFTWSTKKAEETANVSAQALSNALSYARTFVSTNETSSPEACILESINGVVNATDRKAVATVLVPGMEKSQLRVHGKDVNAVRSFLGTVEEGGQVSLLEQERLTIIQRADGAVFGGARFQVAFPASNIPPEGGALEVTFDKKLLEKAVSFLKAGASWEDERITFELHSSGDFELSMLSATGKRTTVPVPTVHVKQGEDAEVVEFNLDLSVLSRVLRATQDTEITLEATPHRDRGYCSVSFDDDHNHYRVVFAWIH